MLNKEGFTIKKALVTTLVLALPNFSKGKLVIGEDLVLKDIILKWLHDSSLGDHSRRYVTTVIVKSLYLLGESTNAIVDKSLMVREATIKLLKFYLLRAQNCMTQQANKHRND
uniref:Uncharacterized protein n=1 Tax=Cajanus cajan TaxID=3821 RepID=A0A151SPN1_CAJCA|nr:hypothetical protein KK1_002957 [Cajanus cajan]